MWETEIICTACGGTHMLCSKIIPRFFEFQCPLNGRRVSIPFRDPSVMPDPWREVAAASPGAVPTLDAEVQGRFEV